MARALVRGEADKVAFQAKLRPDMGLLLEDYLTMQKIPSALELFPAMRDRLERTAKWRQFLRSFAVQVALEERVLDSEVRERSICPFRGSK